MFLLRKNCPNSNCRSNLLDVIFVIRAFCRGITSAPILCRRTSRPSTRRPTGRRRTSAPSARTGSSGRTTSRSTWRPCTRSIGPTPVLSVKSGSGRSTIWPFTCRPFTRVKSLTGVSYAVIGQLASLAFSVTWKLFTTSRLDQSNRVRL